MKRKRPGTYKNYLPGKIFRRFVQHQQASGILLIVTSAVSLFVSSGHFGDPYIRFFETPLNLGGREMGCTPEFLLNDCLMSLFFFLVSIEIKREWVSGELSSPAKAALPLAAALGGMLMPALLYFLLNLNSGYARGWGIPTATDIAFSLAVLSLAMKNVPGSFRIFLTSLAVADDLGAVALIAIFYHGQMEFIYLVPLAAMALLTFFLQKKISFPGIYYLLLTGVFWYLFYKSGIHPTLSGVLSGFLLPARHESLMEHWLEKPVHFLIVPAFAMANTAVAFSADVLLVHPGITLGILAGLCIGKPLGIFLASLAGKRLGLLEWPESLQAKDIGMLGMLAGIGFTMSVFVSHLAFSGKSEADAARIAIVLASVLSALGGYLLLSRRSRKSPSEQQNS